MKLDILPIGLYEENIYILHEEGHVLLVDPGRYPKKIIPYIKEDEIVDGIILTHGHKDHVNAVNDLVDYYHCPVYMDLADLDLVDPKSPSKWSGAPLYCPIEPLQESMQVGHFSLTVYFTPGHTAGSSCIRYRNIMFTGDTLFASSIGRTDLYSGDEKTIYESLRRLKMLDNDIIIYPGHGPSSTMKIEKLKNQYLLGC